MNYIDFDTNPAGFPLESDATLGRMQRNMLDVLNGLVKALYSTPFGFPVIVSGCEISGSSMADGWVLHTDGELYFFEGGTIQSTAIIVENVVTKANQDGTIVNRYFERKMTFGSGPGSFIPPLPGFQLVSHIGQNIARLASAGAGADGWVILSGLEAVSGGSGGIQAGVAIYRSNTLLVNSYNSPVSDVSPRWLGTDGLWYGSNPGNGLQFNPYTNVYLDTYHRKMNCPIGTIQWVKNGSSVLTNYFNSGIGHSKWQGFYIANGSNGTIDLSGAISGVTAIQRIS